MGLSIADQGGACESQSVDILKLGFGGDYGTKFKTDGVANDLTQEDVLIY